METIRTVEDFKRFMKKNHDTIHSRAIKAEHIPADDEWMKEDEWDNIYQREVIDHGKV